MDYAKELLKLFSGSQRIHGVARLTGVVSPKGKKEAKCHTQHFEVTEEQWRLHLLGKQGLGCAPLNDESLVQWGAIDVDDYNIEVVGLAKIIALQKLPLITIFSKSKGAHLYLFTKEWIPAKDMIAALDSYASILGFGKAEIFPKQVSIGRDGKSPDFGNWINMPYYGGDTSIRYAVRPDGTRYSVLEFIELIKSIAVDSNELETIEAVDEDPFPDYPPCLNEIFKQKIQTARNVTLANLAVAIRKEHPDDWQSKLEIENRRFADPLANKEVDNIIKSYEKKEYRFQCRKEPLCHYCNTSLCRSRKYGIGDEGPIPGNRSLTKVNTEPPVWYLDMHLPDGKCVRMALETDELRKPDLFEKACMENIGSLPATYKKDDWKEVVNNLMENMTVVEIPKEMTPRGQLVELMVEFLTNRCSVKESSFEALQQGRPHKDAEGYYFRLRDFQKYLSDARFNLLKPNQITATLREELGGVKQFAKIAGKGTNFIRIPPQFETMYAEFAKAEVVKDLDF
tara:strand:+ start:1603 stop:3135 length:1533 start_codon:yes stop_codon:yes gene_type:complete